MLLHRTIILAAICVLSSGASAKDIKMYLEVRAQEKATKKQVDAFTVYFNGLTDGLQMANAEIKGAALFCLPYNVSFNSSNFREILDNQILKIKDLDAAREFPIGQVLMYALQTDFPCKK